MDRLIETVAVNVNAVVRLTRAVLPPMVAAGSGGVLNVSSLASRFPQRGMATYVATKAFMDSWTRSIRAELAGTGVVVTCVARAGCVPTSTDAPECPSPMCRMTSGRPPTRWSVAHSMRTPGTARSCRFPATRDFGRAPPGWRARRFADRLWSRGTHR